MSGLRGSANVLRRRMGLTPMRPAWAVRVFMVVDLVLARVQPPARVTPRAWGSLQPALCRARAPRPMVGRVR